MKPQLGLMVFSDLDGTLIDHHSYSFHGAERALARLREIGAALVLASSKTAAEIARLRGDLGWEDQPAIVENGAGLLPPHVSAVPDAKAYHAIRAELDRLPVDLRAAYRGFGDMTAEEVTAVCGLPPEQAILAKSRAFSEPGLWSGTPEQRADFLSRLQAVGITGQMGGRFLTLSHGSTKADRMRELIKANAPQHTIALGDAPNDISMLETADFGVVVANPESPPMPQLSGEAEGRIMRTTKAGPHGWNAAVLTLTERLCLQGTD